MASPPSSLALLPLVLLLSCAHRPPVLDRPAAPGFDAQGWGSDLDQLESQLGRAYANLTWNADHRGLDLTALDRETRARLSAARSDREAYEALSRFLGAFGDPHLEAKPDGQPWAQPHLYGIRFRTDGKQVLIGKVLPGPCAVSAGDRVERLEGKPPLDWVERNRTLANTSNPQQAADDALRVLTASPFAPERQLTFTAIHQGREVECRLSPVHPPGAGKAPHEGAAAASAPALTRETSPEEACAFLGVKKKGQANVEPSEHPELEALPGDNPFFAGIVRRDGQPPLGWLRIASFSERHYPQACLDAWRSFRATLTGACDDACQADFLGHHVADRLVADVAARLKELGSARVGAVVLDLSDNGGGTDWVMDVARLLAPKPLECPAAAGVRGPHWAERFGWDAEALASCASATLAESDRSRLQEALTWNARQRQEAGTSCDLSALFRGGPRPACSNLVASRRSACALPPRPEGVSEDCPLFRRSDAPRDPGAVQVPVFVLVNRLTASASELLAAVLQDNHAATVVGERTLGAGCGYTNGGIPLRLAHSGLKVAVPDCARFRLDGRDETEGVLPDRALSWTAEDFVRWQSFGEKALAHSAALFAP